MPDVEINQIRFEELQGGAALEELNAAIDRCVQDLADPNTVAQGKREVTLKLALKPDRTLTSAAVEVTVVTKLGQPEPSEALVFLVRQRGGRMVASEYNPTQQTLDETAAGPIGLVPGAGGSK